MRTLKYFKGIFQTLAFVLVTASALAAPPFTSTTLSPAVPPNITSSGSKPMLMLVASKDHTLFAPAYTDFEDLDGDGIIDTTFKTDFRYYGYFDATKCYLYNNTRFEPNNSATLTSGRYSCGGVGQWSGNFLNWATTIRLDVVRKMLYGGQRFTDTTTETVLQAARLSRDSHSFVKYYRGDDIRDYTPFSRADLTKIGGDNANNYAGLSMCIQSDANNNGITSTPRIRLAKGNYRLWATVEGSTVCNWGSGALGTKLNRYYGGTAAYQGNGGVNHESTPPNLATDGATYSSNGPDLNIRVKVCDSAILGDERCLAYTSGSTTIYKPIGLLQDFGIPQSGSGAARTEFGLITGSYDQNLTGGALRKNMNDLRDEINPTTGQFCFSSGASCSGILADGRSYTSTGAIRSLEQIVLYGKNSGGYDDSNVQLPSELINGTLPAWGNPVGEMVVQALRYYAGVSTSNPSTNPTTTTRDASVQMPVAAWTDPMSETSSTYDVQRKANYGKPICRPLNILALSSSALSFDGDDADSVFLNLPNRGNKTLSQFTNIVGTAEGINGTLRSVGSITGGFGETCSAKTVGNLSEVTGVCPESPSLGGSYKVVGAAYYANMNRVRTPATLPSDMPAFALKVKTYAASLGGGVARIDVKIPGTGTSINNPAKFVYITPEGLWASNSDNKRMPAAMLTFQAISSSNTHGAFVVTWNDSQFGGDYDMDIAGYLRYDIIGTAAPYTLKVTTDIINVGAGWTGSHGFSIIGSGNFDGRYLTHRHLSNDSVISGAAGYLCGNAAYRGSSNLAATTLPPTIPAITGRGDWACDVSSGGNNVRDRDAPVTLTFNMVGVDSVILRDPLWYAAKYGSFNAVNATSTTELPDVSNKWDVRRNDGRSCGGSTGRACADGEPDGYFLARRPELLEQQLRDTLETIINTTNSAPAVSSSQLSAGGFKYVATFEPSQNSGSVLAYALDSTGQFSSNPSWDVGLKLTQAAPASRVVVTNDGISGRPLRNSPAFSTAFQSALTGTGAGSITTAQASELIDYTRGDRSREKLSGGIWRTRSVSNIMGTVINSSPWLQSRPSAQSLGVLPSGAPSYSSFISAQNNRDRLLWVGANDGMLHGFKAQGATGGDPVLSYLPSPLVDRLRTLSIDFGTAVIAGMDGSPYTGDVLTGTGPSATWKTYLFSSLGRGAKAVFALDVTSPAALTDANASNIFKWMFSSADDSDLGFVLGDAQLHPVSNQASSIVRMNNDKYAILVPNGLGSASGKAFLYVLFVDGPNVNGDWTSGTHYIKIPTDNVTGNGLMGVNWADTNSDGKADIIYGTDAKGRLWKFDVSSATSSNWKSAFPLTGTPTPLFTATSGSNSLPITTAPVLTFPSTGGVMVGFGTGSAIAAGDFPDTSKTQRFYSIYDRLNWATRALPSSDLSTLAPRTLVRDSSGSVYISTGNTAFDPATKDGWYINFPALPSSTFNNEMVLSTPQLRGDTIFFTTVRPKSSTADQCYKDPEGTIYALDPLSGTPKLPLLGTMPLVVNGTSVTVNKVGTGIGDQKVTIPVQGTTSKGNFKIVGQKSNLDLPEFLRLMRRQWREIPGMRTDQ